MPIIKKEKEILPPEHFVVPWEKHKIKMREALTWTIVVLIIISTLLTYSIILLKGFNKLPGLTDSVLHWLGGATLGNSLSCALIIIKSLFRPAIKEK
jgi:hypothetical protein